MATILLRVSVRDHDSGGGGYFYPYGDRSVGWRRSIESEGKRIENLNAETCKSVIRVKSYNQQLKGQLILVPEIITSGNRPAVKIMSALWHDTLPPLVNISIIEEKLRNEDFKIINQDESPEAFIKITPSELKKSTIWTASAIELIGREASKLEDILTEGYSKEDIFCAWANTPYDIRQNTELVIGGPKTPKSKQKRRWHHSINGTKTPLVTDTEMYSNYTEGGTYTLQEILKTCDSIKGKGNDWWKNLQLLFDGYGIKVQMNRMSLMRQRLHLFKMKTDVTQLSHLKLRSDAIRDLELLIRSNDTKALDIFFMSGLQLDVEEIRSLSPKRRFVVVSEMLTRFQHEAISILQNNLANLNMNEIHSLLQLINIDFNYLESHSLDWSRGRKGSIASFLQKILQHDPNLFLHFLRLQIEREGSQKSIHYALGSIGIQIPAETISILGQYTELFHPLTLDTLFDSIKLKETYSGEIGNLIADAHISMINRIPNRSADWLPSIGTSLQSNHSNDNLRNWLNKLAIGLPNRLKSKYRLDFSKLWPSNDSPWVRILFSQGSKSELKQLFFHSDTSELRVPPSTESFPPVSTNLRNSLSDGILGDWLRRERSLISRPYRTYSTTPRKELFRLHISPNKLEIANGLLYRFQFYLCMPLFLLCIIGAFLDLYNVINFHYSEETSKMALDITTLWVLFGLASINTFFSRKRFRLLMREANL